jgi:hypothetical protein
MADNYLENAREQYEKKKALWLSKRKHSAKKTVREVEKPEDWAL